MKDYCTLLLILSLVVIGFTGCDNLTGVIGDSYKTPMDEPEAFTLAFVQEAIDLYKTDGIEATVAHYGNQKTLRDSGMYLSPMQITYILLTL